MKLPTLAASIALFATACAVAPAVSVPLPPERVGECRANCESVGLRLSAIVLISNRAGCVCVPADAPPGAATVSNNAAATAAAEATVIDDEEAAQRSSQQTHH